MKMGVHAAEWNVDSPRAKVSEKGERHDDKDEDARPEENDKEQAAAAHAHAAPAGNFIFKTELYDDDKDT